MYEYPFGNGQQLNLDWFLTEWKNLLAAWEAEKNGIDGALQAEIDRAEAALADVFAARDAAAQSAANALESKNAAAQSAANALESKNATAQSAANALESKNAAAQSASDASGYLSTVQQNATAAQDAARNAADSAQTALASKNNAADSASAAADSQTAAGNSANAAAQSAEDAEDAAETVQASVQQITTNANNIAVLQQSSINNSFHIEHLRDDAPFTGFINGENGYFNESNAWFASDYIFVTSNVLKIFCCLFGNGGLAFYDINKTYISGINGNNAANYGFSQNAIPQERNITVPENAFFIRFSALRESANRIYMDGTTNLNNLIHYLSNAKALQITRALTSAINNQQTKTIEETE